MHNTARILSRFRHGSVQWRQWPTSHGPACGSKNGATSLLRECPYWLLLAAFGCASGRAFGWPGRPGLQSAFGAQGLARRTTTLPSLISNHHNNSSITFSPRCTRQVRLGSHRNTEGARERDCPACHPQAAGSLLQVPLSTFILSTFAASSPCGSLSSSSIIGSPRLGFCLGSRAPR